MSIIELRATSLATPIAPGFPKSKVATIANPSIHARLCSSVSVLLLLIPGISISAAAQTSVVLEEVIVTAQKRSENVQDVPISMIAFSGDQLEASGIDTLIDLQNFVPNLNIGQGSQLANTRIMMRGVGSAGNNAIEPSVGTFIDGVFYARPSAVLGNLVDIQSVEVLRGPQGTLFGRNTPMGALSISTKKPTDELSGRVKLGLGDYGMRTGTGIVNIPLADSVAARISGSYSDRDGFGTTTFTGAGPTGDFGEREDTVVRAKFLFDISESWQATLSADYSETDQGAPVTETLPQTNPQFGGFEAYTARVLGLFGDIVEIGDPDDYTINKPVRDRTVDEQWGLALDITGDIGEHSIRSITAYRDWENDVKSTDFVLAADFLLRDGNFATESFSQEFQLLSPEGQRLEYVLGLYYYEEDYDIGEQFNLGSQFCSFVPPPLRPRCSGAPQSPASTVDYSQSLESFAGFGQMTYHISEDWSATAGLRFTRDEKEAEITQVTSNPILSILGFRASLPLLELDRSDSQPTWLLSSQYTLTEDMMLYASVSTGFKSGGFNSQGSGDPLTAEERSFDPEETTNYEVGIKSTLAEGKLIANATVYRTEVADLQDRTLDADTASFLVKNAAELTQQGVEFELRARPTAALDLSLTGAYLDSEFDSYPGASGLPAGLPQDLAGQRNHRSPKWELSTVAQLTLPLADSGMDWFVRGEYSFRDEMNVGTTTNGNRQTVQDAYSLVNLRGGLMDREGRWQVSAHLENATDEAYCQTMFEQPLGGPLRAVDAQTNTSLVNCILGSPRMWSVEVEYNFD
ncbi:TonB-dependent receptor [Luminiphilus syltensis NOR5-1B]|uniref:TonB-dependent receptor n=1 Tax=Luminiphilus syltensis NOR5-1B TaxID=565045 RepID=B8KV78_9GAMM|nr:TonB-dependent receptor [Luminiphilus syltensis]EED36302.1 TonB-dependent receptor [Luminiphilus syltensis NOR5-1B]